jgi:hypothetical protein
VLNLKRVAQAGIAEEFVGARLGDARRTRRLQRIAERAMEAPGAGFPRMVADDSELEGVYRFLNCEHIEAEDVLEAHFQASLVRMREVDGPVLVVHDTTDLRFGGFRAREGLGPTHGKQQGFLVHMALAVLPGKERLALGGCGVLRICRSERKKTRTKSWYEMSKDPERESLRWSQLVEQVDARCQGIDCIHLMDREGDNYDLFALMLRKNARFVVRACHDRALADGGRLLDVLEQLEPKVRRVISLNERLDDGRRTHGRRHPPRIGRTARVEIAGATVALRKTPSAQAPEERITVNVVHVWEPSPPKGQPPVCWFLYTTEPIATKKQLLAVVDHYRSRWVIEEFFKALKTGCGIEKRQLESYHGLSLALAVFIPVAWRLLLLRSISRKIPNAPARTVASDIQLQLLRHRFKLDAIPRTTEAAAYAVAKLGGHLRRNGPPGWRSLGQGLEALLLMEAGWKAAMDARRSDQS